MEKYKKSLILLSIIVLVPLLTVGTVMWIVDPFFVYHAPLEKAYYIVDNQLEQNPGIAKHFEYDSVMLGSSMTTNFDTDMFDELLGTKMVKLSYNAAQPKDIDRIMQIVTQEKEELSHVFLCIDIANYMNTPGLLSYPYPEHLYDDNIFNDLKYLLNKEVLFDYVIDGFLGKKKIAVNEIYWHWQYMTYSREHVLANYVVPKTTGQTSTKYTLDNLKINLEKYIIPYIEASPNTKWYIFFPPYSMLYWNDSMAVGEEAVKMEGISYITECLGQYDNVSIHYFQDMEEWVCNLDNYTDATHFSKQITDEMTMMLCEGVNKVDDTTFEQRLAVFKEWIESFDYTGFIEGSY